MLLWEAVSTRKPPQQGRQTVIQPVTARLRSLQPPDRCTAVTRVGRHCRCRKAPGSEFCAFHDPVLSAQIREKAQAKREERRRQLGALPEGYLKTLTNVDGIASALDRLYREVRLGVVSPRTAAVMLAIVDRLLAYDKLVSTVGRHRVSKKRRALEVRQQVAKVLDEMKVRGPAKPLKAAPPAPPVPKQPAAQTANQPPG